MTLNNIFSSFFYMKNLNDSIDIKKLEKGAYDCRKFDKGTIVSNCGGWHSSSYNSFEKDDYKQKLINLINVEINSVATEFGIKDKKLNVSNFWFNINGKKDYNKIHSHLKSVFSGVYYIKVPDRCGRLIFDAPHTELMLSYLNYWHLDVDEFNEYNSSMWSIDPTPGDLVIFPSWLAHYTEPNMSNKDRIVLVFNSGVVKD